MNQPFDDDRDIQHFFQAAFDENRNDDMEGDLRKCFVGFRERLETPLRFSWAGRFLPGRWVWSGGALLATILMLMLSFTILQSPGGKAYAAAMQALQSVRTIHIQGWSNSVSQFTGVYAGEISEASKPFQVEAWEWLEDDGLYRSYKQSGPFFVREDGDRRYEYNQDTGILYIRNSEMDLLKKAPEASFRLLESLAKYTLKRTDLGERTIHDSRCLGMSIESDKRRKEYWFAQKSNLPIEMSFYRLQDDQWKQYTFIQFFYDQPVPQSVLAYSGPENPKRIDYDWAIDPRFEKWHERLRQLASRYQTHPFPNRMELVARSTEEMFQVYNYGTLPGIRDYVVHSLQTSLGDYLRSSHYYGTIRVPQEYQSLAFNHDLVLHRDILIPEQTRFILDSVGLTMGEEKEERTVWVARDDGRSLQPWKEVKAPVSSEGASCTMPGMASGFGPTSLTDLINSFNYWQDYDLTAQGIFIIDETGLPKLPDINANREPYAICCEYPYWGGDESLEIARQWFEREFGITFQEEKREITISVIIKKEPEE